MSKILIYPKTILELNKNINNIDGFIIGIEDMCVNTPLSIKIEELDILNYYQNKDIFININKSLHNKDINVIKEILMKLNKYNIKGILYYDIAILNIYNNLDLNYELVYSNEHSNANYNTINYWVSKGVKYTHLSSDITIDEIIEISKNTTSKLLVNLFGYLPMFVSYRHIVKNYLNYFNLEDNSNINYIKKEGKIYPIIDNKIGTMVYSNNILNGIKYVLDLNIDYIILNGFLIDEENFSEVINLFKTVNKTNIESYNKTINDMFLNIDTGFLERKTIYKVKKDEKKD